MNYFQFDSVGQRYARHRPYFHPLVMSILAQAFREPLSRALDVGCGTGDSTRALLEIASEAVGCDASPAMLAQCPRDERLHFVEAHAENLPFEDASFSLLSAGMAFHWFSAQPFFREAERVLEEGGALVIYDYFFRVETGEDPAWREWLERFREVYPPPARNVFAPDMPLAYGFELVRATPYSHLKCFTREALADSLSTQSNVIAKVELGLETLEEATAKIRRLLEPIYHPIEQREGEAAREREFRMGGTVYRFRKCKRS